LTDPPTDGVDRRRSPRAPFCVPALVIGEAGVAEHLTYDLSVGGVRLCGLPRAAVGEGVELLLPLGPRERLHATGRLVRVDAGSRLQFAVAFDPLERRAADAIQAAVLRHLEAGPGRRVLLYREADARTETGMGWLAPVLSQCSIATSPLEAIGYLELEPIELAIFDWFDHAFRARRMPEAFPEIAWRAIDEVGRLHPGAAAP